MTESVPPRMSAREIVKRAGGLTACARRLRQLISANGETISVPSIHRWITRDKIPAQRVGFMSELTGLPPHAIRPDIFRAPQDSEAA